MPQTAESVEIFRSMHAGEQVLLLANAWDAGSAALIRSAGAKAIATTSAGLAWSCGYPDGNMLPRESLLSAVRAICRVAGELPVSVDFEGGYSEDPAAVADLAAAVADLGVAGINIEDGESAPALLAEKIRAIKRSCKLFINARTDVLLRKLAPDEDAVRESIVRARRYVEAGADGIFVPLVTQSDAIRTIARSVERPLNVLAVPSLPTLKELQELGVRRVSAGALISRFALGAARNAVAAFLEAGPTEALFAQPRLENVDMNALLKS
ncbi:MAG: isocitrate lyase/PEP mutase family protein [Candidatus Eremiobacter antarcticus]